MEGIVGDPDSAIGEISANVSSVGQRPSPAALSIQHGCALRPIESRPASGLSPPVGQDDETRPTPLRTALSENAARFPHVRVVRDYAVLRQIGAIRHRQYVESQGKPYVSIVLDRGCLIEPSDFSAVNICATDAHGITCAMRIGQMRDPHNLHMELFLRAAQQFDVSVDRTLTCTRLVRAPRHNGRHAVDLIRFVRWQTVHAGWRYCIMQTAEKLVPFFRKLEFHETGIWTDDPSAGRLQVLILDTGSRPIREKEVSCARS